MKKGFTLIELLAVIVILAIVMVITIPRVLDSLRSAKISAYTTDIVGIYKTLEKRVNEAELDLNDPLTESSIVNTGNRGELVYSQDCPSEYWAETKDVCQYLYDADTGLSSLLIKVNWDFDANTHYVTYDGVNFEYLFLGE
jgi:prepilin-type N-terminal cleavage/methylation domain-containing protein